MNLSEAGRPEKRVLWISTATFTVLFAVWLMLGVLAVPLEQELGLNQAQVSWAAALAVLTGSIFRVPFGLLADRWGGKKTMLLSALLCVPPCIGMAYVSSYPALLAWAAWYGLAGNSFAVGVSWNARWTPRERQGLALGTFGAGNVGASLTKVLAPLVLLGSAASQPSGLLPGGLRVLPLFYAGLLTACAAAIAWATPSDQEAAAPVKRESSWVRLRDQQVLRLSLEYVVVFGAYVALCLWLPRYLAVNLGLPLATAAALSALFIFPASLLRPLGGYFSDRFGATKVSSLAVGTCALMSFLLSFPPERLGLVPVVLLIVSLGVGMGVGKAATFKQLASAYPREVGSVGGIVATLGALGGFFLPLIFSCVSSASKLPSSCFMVLCALAVASWAWSAWATRDRAKDMASALEPAQ